MWTKRLERGRFRPAFSVDGTITTTAIEAAELALIVEGIDLAEPATITSSHAPDIAEIREWMEKMIKAMRLVDLVVAVIALITRMRDMNTELTKRLTNLRRKRPRSETLARVERQPLLKFATMGIVNSALIPVIHSDDSEADKNSARKTRRGRHPGRAALPQHLERVPEVNFVPSAMRSARCMGRR
jgi:Transposase C of IS166 homeodomain